MIAILFYIYGHLHFTIDYKSYILEQYLRNKKIEYRMWWSWPKYYDCWWVLTEAFRLVWYRWFKLNSHFYLMGKNCKIQISEVKKWDVLVNTNEWQWHIALITKNLGRTIEILDFVSKYNRSSYRIHGQYDWIYFLSKDCLLQNN